MSFLLTRSTRRMHICFSASGCPRAGQNRIVFQGDPLRMALFPFWRRAVQAKVSGGKDLALKKGSKKNWKLFFFLNFYRFKDRFYDVQFIFSHLLFCFFCVSADHFNIYNIFCYNERSQFVQAVSHGDSATLRLHSSLQNERPSNAEGLFSRLKACLNPRTQIYIFEKDAIMHDFSV